MSFASSVCCVNILQQQREQNVQYKTESHSVADKQCQNTKNCTVVENGRVVVKPLQPSSDETEATQST